MKVTNEAQDQQAVNITELFLSFKQQNRNVFMYQIDSIIFMYRTIGRSEYKELLKDDSFSVFEKEDLICQLCTLHPQNFDFENCEAGLPSILASEIIKNSYLDSEESRRKVIDYYRNDMFDLDNQITCIINEAFPQFDIEEIEEWDIEKTTKYLSRAEWKLHNLRGLNFVEPKGDFYYSNPTQNTAPQQTTVTEEIGGSEKAETKTNHRGGEKEKLTPEKLRELKAKFPGINWEADDGNKGMQGFNQPSIDTTPPALRSGW